MVCTLGLRGGQWEAMGGDQALGCTGMSGRPLEEQTGAQGKQSVTFVLLV